MPEAAENPRITQDQAVERTSLRKCGTPHRTKAKGPTLWQKAVRLGAWGSPCLLRALWFGLAGSGGRFPWRLIGVALATAVGPVAPFSSRHLTGGWCLSALNGAVVALLAPARTGAEFGVARWRSCGEEAALG